jgi:hypothetical protein
MATLSAPAQPYIVTEPDSEKQLATSSGTKLVDERGVYALAFSCSGVYRSKDSKKGAGTSVHHILASPLLKGAMSLMKNATSGQMVYQILGNTPSVATKAAFTPATPEKSSHVPSFMSASGLAGWTRGALRTASLALASEPWVFIPINVADPDMKNKFYYYNIASVETGELLQAAGELRRVNHNTLQQDIKLHQSILV